MGAGLVRDDKAEIVNGRGYLSGPTGRRPRWRGRIYINGHVPKGDGMPIAAWHPTETLPRRSVSTCPKNSIRFLEHLTNCALVSWR